ncbi:MAG: hypothetical protein AAF937_08690 [Planctomycetota bacterium]
MKREMKGERGMLMAAAGLAIGLTAGVASGQSFELVGRSMEGATTLRPNAVQPILGVRMDGSLVLGERVVMSGADASAQSRGIPAPRVVYDSIISADTDGDGLAEPVCGDLCGGLSLPSSRFFIGNAALAWVDDIEVSGAAVSGASNFEGYVLSLNLVCDPAVQEPLIIISTLYDSPVSGFDTDGDGQVDSPYSRTDANGDGLVDEFTGGAIVTFANVDTDGDPSNGNEVLDAPGFFQFFSNNLTDTDGDGIGGDPGALDFGGFPVGDRDGDGDPDGALEFFFAGSEGPDTDGDGVPDSGSIFNAFEASNLGPNLVFWGTPDSDTSGCAASFGITEGSSSGIVWIQEESECSSDPAVAGDVWDPATDLTDLTGVVACPTALTPSIALFGLGEVEPDNPCADTNLNGTLDPGDFNAWVIQFNTQGPGCDQNGDGQCTPADFNAWVLNFNSGSDCP